MATDATGTPTALGIPKFNTSVDSPSGLGSNAQMDAIDALIQANTGFQGAGITIKANKLISTDANPAYQVKGDGTISWGAGGASAVDTVLGRTGAGVLRVTGTLNATAGLQINGTSIFASPALTGVPTAPTAPVNTNTTQIATTEFVLGQGFISSPPVLTVFGRTTNVVAQTGDYTVAQVTGAAPLASPTFTGTPAAPTPATGDNSTTIATTAFVKAQAYATLASPALTGTPTAPTPLTADNSTKIATTAYVQAQGYNTGTVVNSFKGRTGVVTPATADYTAAQVTNAFDKSSTSLQSGAGGYVSTHTSNGIGYSTGAGGTVTQATSGSTGVTLNSPTGQITTFTYAVSGGLLQTFVVTNSSIAAADVVVVSWKSQTWGQGMPIWVQSVAAGSFTIAYYNPGGLTASGAGVINFAILKGATA